MQRLSDAGRLLSDIHHSETVSRRELVTMNLNKDWKDTLSESPMDEWLFGTDLEERLKTAKSLQATSKQLKPTRTPLKKANFTKPLNSRSPSKYQQGAKQDGRYRRTPTQTSRPPARTVQERSKNPGKYYRH